MMFLLVVDDEFEMKRDSFFFHLFHLVTCYSGKNEEKDFQKFFFERFAILPRKIFFFSSNDLKKKSFFHLN